MVQIKTFCADSEENLDRKVNDWLERNSPHLNISNTKVNYQMQWQGLVIAYSAMVIYEK